MSTGYARILVIDEVVQLSDVKIEKPLTGCVAWDWLEVKELFDTWQSFLQLPDGYRVVRAFFDIAYDRWTLIIESEVLPTPKEGEVLPLLYPMYQRTADGKVSIIMDSLKLKEERTSWQFSTQNNASVVPPSSLVASPNFP